MLVDFCTGLLCREGKYLKEDRHRLAYGRWCWTAPEMMMVPELNRTKEHGEIKPGVVSQRRTSRDQWLILVSVILVNIVCSVTLLEMKMMKVRFQTRSPGYLYLCSYMCWNEKPSNYSFFLVFWYTLKMQLNFVGPLICAETLIFQGPCTILEELENRKTISEQKLCCEMKSRALGLLKMWEKSYRTKEQSALIKGI